ncbi:TetR family transcriptional regulator [Haematobacter massiliensis]|uniref:Transcriptional regulator n=1 Tax=Haematobacter massiliensis TaxID=195105 RepID=A0A086Y5R7_9RHOB|nr:TetR/AcrR family transcriptional regulator [Haematobacter massiliensis]KFI29617.1 transcriptional regulator [Haematobacter massiliensis]OWJ72993.1 TetR family transcriptional regulator [Haematobacter massiliensis]OWJ88471.1 TetR family transcriptional regulator [Haematobacter massiliensis]QBJ25693.1 TetR/AcrR family transcriptional regulator [Haematobacter massiliensis]
MGESGPKARKPRTDQIRNRERLLVAAREVFRAEGASLEAVARKAGLGIGTLYRHFPTRESLYQAVYEREVEELVRLAEAMGAEEGLGRWMMAALDMMATKKGMIAALAPVIDPAAPFYSEQSARMRSALASLHARAVVAGSMRPDVTPEDLMRILIGLSYGPGADPTRSQLLLEVFLTGLTRP